MLAFALREPQIGGGVVDILVRPEVPYVQLKKNAIEGVLFSQQVWIAAIDDLLTMKRVANRPKDRLDIEALEKIKRGEDPNV
jgi:flagellar biosynthesis regulator FlaF